MTSACSTPCRTYVRGSACQIPTALYSARIGAEHRLIAIASDARLAEDEADVASTLWVYRRVHDRTPVRRAEGLVEAGLLSVHRFARLQVDPVVMRRRPDAHRTVVDQPLLLGILPERLLSGVLGHD